MNTARKILDHIGRDPLKTLLGVQDSAIRKAKAEGVIPAQWFDACERLAGQPLDRRLFTFKGQEIQP